MLFLCFCLMCVCVCVWPFARAKSFISIHFRSLVVYVDLTQNEFSKKKPTNEKSQYQPVIYWPRINMANFNFMLQNKINKFKQIYG